MNSFIDEEILSNKTPLIHTKETVYRLETLRVKKDRGTQKNP
jgi:hypothetical protein